MGQTRFPFLLALFALVPFAVNADMCGPDDQHLPSGPFRFCDLDGVFQDEEHADLQYFSYAVAIGETPDHDPLAKISLTLEFLPLTGTAAQALTPLGPQITAALKAHVCMSSDYGGFVKSGGEIEFIFRYPTDFENEVGPVANFSTTITSCEAN